MYENDEELDEIFQDIDNLAALIVEDETGTFVPNLRKIKDIESLCQIIKKITKGNGVKVTYSLHEPFASMGSITVIGKEIKITYPKLFALAIRVSSNFEIYPKTDGTVQMNFTFHDIARKVDD